MLKIILNNELILKGGGEEQEGSVEKGKNTKLLDCAAYWGYKEILLSQKLAQHPNSKQSSKNSES